MELDCDWTQDKAEQAFDDFYKEPVQNLQIYYYYVNREKELFHIKKDSLIINNGVLEKDHLIYLIGKNRNYNNSKFQPLSLLKYNITINPEDINFFLKDNDFNQFLSVEKNIDSIKWQDTITLFQDLNALIIIYSERISSQNKTKKIYIRGRKRKTKRLKYF